MNNIIELIYSQTVLLKDKYDLLEDYKKELVQRIKFINKPLHGIENINNTCFYNSLLQLIYAVPDLELTTNDYFHQILNFMKYYYRNNIKLTTVITKNTLLYDVINICPYYKFGEHEDISEFLQYLFLNKYNHSDFNVEIKKYHLYDLGVKEINNINENILSLSIPDIGDYTLENLLKHYTSITKNTDVTTPWNYSDNKSTIDYYIKEELSFSKNIIINLKRYKYINPNKTRYIDNNINMPLFIKLNGITFELLSFTNYTQYSQSKGHYTCIAKHDNEWYLFNDELVKSVNVYDYKDKGYIYIYHRTLNLPSLQNIETKDVDWKDNIYNSIYNHINSNTKSNSGASPGVSSLFKEYKHKLQQKLLITSIIYNYELFNVFKSKLLELLNNIPRLAPELAPEFEFESVSELEPEFEPELEPESDLAIELPDKISNPITQILKINMLEDLDKTYNSKLLKYTPELKSVLTNLLENKTCSDFPDRSRLRKILRLMYPINKYSTLSKYKTFTEHQLCRLLNIKLYKQDESIPIINPPNNILRLLSNNYTQETILKYTPELIVGNENENDNENVENIIKKLKLSKSISINNIILAGLEI